MKPTVPKWEPKTKSVPDATIYRTEKGYRVVLEGQRDPILGQKVREVKNGKWWYYRGTLTKET